MQTDLLMEDNNYGRGIYQGINITRRSEYSAQSISRAIWRPLDTCWELWKG
jgi:hypothetical protein